MKRKKWRRKGSYKRKLKGRVKRVRPHKQRYNYGIFGRKSALPPFELVYTDKLRKIESQLTNIDQTLENYNRRRNLLDRTFQVKENELAMEKRRDEELDREQQRVQQEIEKYPPGFKETEDRRKKLVRKEAELTLKDLKNDKRIVDIEANLGKMRGEQFLLEEKQGAALAKAFMDKQKLAKDLNYLIEYKRPLKLKHKLLEKEARLLKRVKESELFKNIGGLPPLP